MDEVKIPGHGVGQNIFADGLPFGRAESERAFTQTLGHRAQRFFTRGDDRRQHHQAKGEPAGEKRNVPTEKNHEQPEAEKSKDNRRHAGEIENRDSDEPDEARRCDCTHSDKSRC